MGWSRTMESLARFVAISVPVLYVVGRSYIEGYWLALNLDVDLMHYEFNEYLYFGFFCFLAGINKLFVGNALLHTTFFLGAVFSIIGIYLLTGHLMSWAERLAERKRALLISFATRHRWLWLIRYGRPLFAIAIASNVVLSLVLAAALLGAVPVQVARALGKDIGNSTRQRVQHWRQSPPTWPPVRLKSGESISDLRLLQCSTDWCVVANPKGVIVIPKDDVAMVVGAGNGVITAPLRWPAMSQKSVTN